MVIDLDPYKAETENVGFSLDGGGGGGGSTVAVLYRDEKHYRKML